MYVKQGLKREEAIDFVRERLALISAGVSKLSTNVCAISEFVTRTWGVIRVKIQFSCFAVLFLLFRYDVLSFCFNILSFCYSGVMCNYANLLCYFLVLSHRDKEINFLFSTFISQDTSARVEDHIPLPDTEKFSNVQIKSDEHFSVIPKTLGTRRKPFDEVCTE